MSALMVHSNHASFRRHLWQCNWLDGMSASLEHTHNAWTLRIILFSLSKSEKGSELELYSAYPHWGHSTWASSFEFSWDRSDIIRVARRLWSCGTAVVCSHPKVPLFKFFPNEIKPNLLPETSHSQPLYRALCIQSTIHVLVAHTHNLGPVQSALR